MTEITAKLRKLDIAPRKTRAVIRIISGLPIGDAEAQLLFRKERAARPILKLLKSAVANAKNKGVSINNLYIKSIWADEGQVMKRWLPRARGMATPLHKKFSHVTIVLATDIAKVSRFAVSENKIKKSGQKSAKKAVKTAKKQSSATKKLLGESRKGAPHQSADNSKTENTGILKTDSPIKKMFRRKSV